MQDDALHTKNRVISDLSVVQHILSTPNSLLLETTRSADPNSKNLLFSHPEEILIGRDQKECIDILERLDEILLSGKYIAGYIGYEAMHSLEQLPYHKEGGQFPLIWLGVFDSPSLLSPGLIDHWSADNDTEIGPPTLQISIDEYSRAIETIKAYIAAGDTYQVNYTNHVRFQYANDPISLYLRLRKKQHVPYSAFITTEFGEILSFSPELFFKRHGSTIECRPMKGTHQRGMTLAQDHANSEWLANDEKNRSENLMIVDLLRNDLGRICTFGSVETTDLFTVERLETVLQMTSGIRGTLREGISHRDIFSALFPCGSVTGAPKIRTMQIIQELETGTRGVYCGAIGYLSPHKEAVFSVAIRTIEKNGADCRMGVGSGIIFDSKPSKEYAECLLKGKFLTEGVTFSLLETMAWKNGFQFLPEHLDRMKESAEYFFYPFHREMIIAALQNEAVRFDDRNAYRVRVLVDSHGSVAVSSSQIIEEHRTPIIKIAPKRTQSTSPFYFHKTSYRPLYDPYFEKARAEKIMDYIFLNEHDIITEGSYTNIFVEKEGQLLTSPEQAGLIGIYRKHVLKTKPNAREKELTVEDLQTAEKIYVCNSVRGLVEVSLSQ